MTQRIDEQHCRDTCGEPHGFFCSEMETIKKEISELRSDIKEIVNNRNAARNFFIANGISVLAVLVALYSTLSERHSNDNNRNFSPPERHGNFESGNMSGYNGPNGRGDERDSVK
jgi:hypothetical protein